MSNSTGDASDDSRRLPGPAVGAITAIITAAVGFVGALVLKLVPDPPTGWMYAAITLLIVSTVVFTIGLVRLLSGAGVGRWLWAVSSVLSLVGLALLVVQGLTVTDPDVDPPTPSPTPSPPIASPTADDPTTGPVAPSPSATWSDEQLVIDTAPADGGWSTERCDDDRRSIPPEVRSRGAETATIAVEQFQTLAVDELRVAVCEVYFDPSGEAPQRVDLEYDTPAGRPRLISLPVLAEDCYDGWRIRATKVEKDNNQQNLENEDVVVLETTRDACPGTQPRPSVTDDRPEWLDDQCEIRSPQRPPVPRSGDFSTISVEQGHSLATQGGLQLVVCNADTDGVVSLVASTEASGTRSGEFVLETNDCTTYADWHIELVGVEPDSDTTNPDDEDTAVLNITPGSC